MLCPNCQADNADGVLSCSRCGTALLVAGDSGTLGGDPDLTAAETSPVIPKASAAIGVATPAPGSSLTTPPPGRTWQSPYGAPHLLEPGSDFGPRYRIEVVLGRGGMGTVYKAYDKELDRTVALKLVRPDLTTDPAVMQRFRQELLLASKVSHKNVLRIHDLGDVDGLKFISMAYIEGEDLHHLLEKRGRLAPDYAADIAHQLCEALEAAHAQGVVHRDLKPQNVLIDREGNAYVSDFGLAKSLEAGAAMMTGTGEILGTPRYMSPEQVEGKPADGRSDLYALGLILYEMVTGDVPFKGDSTLQVMYQRIKDRPKDPQSVNPEVPDYLARIIMRCLERDPDHRYQTAQEIIRDLEAPRTPLGFRAWRISVPAHPTRVAALAGVLILAAFTGFWELRDRVWQRPTPLPARIAGIPSLTSGKYIAVLPFRVLGDRSALGYVAEGLQDALAAKLFQLKDVHIASNEAIEKMNAQKSLLQAARELGANLIVDGTLQGAGGKIAVIANLRDMTTGQLRWSQEFSGVPDDLLTLEDHIYSQLVNALELKPSSEELARASAHPTENVQAYDLYLKGREAMHGQPAAKNYQTAIDDYQKALVQDPNFALAYAGLAEASLAMYKETKDRFWSDKALGAAERAQRLNGNLPEVHLALGSVYDATGRSAQAIEELQRAVALAPNSDDAYRRLGNAYLAAGNKNKAIPAFEKAVQIDPYYWVNVDQLAIAYDTFGDYENALRAFRKVIELEPASPMGYENVGLVYMQEGRYSESISSLEKALQLDPSFQHYSNLGSAYLYVKRYADAVRMLEKAVAMSPNQEAVVGNLAQAYLFLGQKEKAQETFNQAIALAYRELQVNPRDAATMADLALYYANTGSAAHAIEFIRNARSIDPANPDYAYDEAVVNALTATSQAALQSLRQALQKGCPPQKAASDPQLAVLQSRPEFRQLIQQFSR
jgi:tetratricopeptide (TPR) repeat protein/predicted Ser/Thr protein kinase